MTDGPPAARPSRRRRRGFTAAILLPVMGALAACGRMPCELPNRLAGLPQTLAYRDGAGLAAIERHHGLHLNVRSVAFAAYGGGAASLWVASARDTAAAQLLLGDITSRVGRGDTPFRPESLTIVGRHAVRELTGLGQCDFYFRSGRCVVWLAANRRFAATALEEVLRFYR